MPTEIHEESLVMTFDHIMRCFSVLNDATAEEECLRILRLQEQFHQEHLQVLQEKARMGKELDNALKSLSDYETKLFHARRLLEMEGKTRREAELERDSLEKRIGTIVDLLQHERNLKDETKNKLAVLNTLPRKRKSKSKHLEEKYGNDINSTGSFLSDLSITQSEDDFLDVHNSKEWFSHRPSLSKNPVPCIGMKRSRLSGGNPLTPIGAHSTPPVATRRSGVRRSLAKHLNNKMNECGAGDAGADVQNAHQVHVGQGAERISATTKVTIPQDGTGIIHAESTIESMPVAEVPQQKVDDNKTSKNSFISPIKPYKQATAPPMTPLKTPLKTAMAQTPQTARATMLRQHNFTSKTFIRVDNCMHCQRKIRFGAVGLRCRDCHVRVHPDCRYLLALSCVPTTPTLKGGSISDHAPSVPPMIPALIVHCVNEVETRGLKEEGIYRLSRTEREIKALMERFNRGRGKSAAPYLGNIDVHVLCGCVKDFLRSLREPLIPTNLWKDFCNAAQNPNEVDKEKDLYKAIDALPQANRDTLAFLILHFQRIAECEEVRMPIENLARIFGPTIVGYSSRDPDQHAIFTEVYAQYQVMFHLLKIPTAYWTQFVAVTQDHNIENDNTPNRNKDSLYSLYASPLKSTLKKRKFYATPPYSAKK